MGTFLSPSQYTVAHGRHATPIYDGLPLAYDCMILLDDNLYSGNRDRDAKSKSVRESNSGVFYHGNHILKLGDVN